MSNNKSKIEWTDSTWSPVTGCSKVSAGCKYCYAERMWVRLSADNMPYVGRKFTDVMCHPDRLNQPLRWKKPRKIFVNSMSDLFHEDVPDIFILLVFAVMEKARQHTFQVLTKRPERMAKFMKIAGTFVRTVGIDTLGSTLGGGLTWPLPNVWLGVSVEDQATADERIPLLLQTPAAVRFISFEPALGPVDFSPFLYNKPVHEMQTERRVRLSGSDVPGYIEDSSRRPTISWLIQGGESGPGARPMHPDWVRDIRDQCKAAGVAFLFKQWGEWRPADDEEIPERFGDECNDFRCMCSNGFVGDLSIGSAFLHKPASYPQCFPGGDDSDAVCNSVYMRKVGKKKAGRLLDGVLHDEYPG